MALEFKSAATLRDNLSPDIGTQFGHPSNESTRWRRVVTRLDELLPRWRLDAAPQSNHLGDAVCITITNLVRAAAAPARKTPADYGTEPVHRSWLGSYTQRVVSKLTLAVIGTPSITPNSEVHKASIDAVHLLKDYHECQHKVYEERDAARKELAQLQYTLANFGVGSKGEGIEQLKGQSQAWYAVVGQLNKHNPRTFNSPGSGQQNAVDEIARLQEVARHVPFPGPFIVRDARLSFNKIKQPPVPSEEEVRSAIFTLAHLSRTAATEVLESFGAPRLREVPKAQWAKLLAKVRARRITILEDELKAARDAGKVSVDFETRRPYSHADSGGV